MAREDHTTKPDRWYILQSEVRSIFFFIFFFSIWKHASSFECAQKGNAPTSNKNEENADMSSVLQKKKSKNRKEKKTNPE
jgi:hypothetical protein